jgi:hypothetical protein
MNAITPTPQQPDEQKPGWLSTQTIIGIGIVLFGIAILLKRADINIPRWVMGWEMIVLLIGIGIGLKSKFKDVSWIILVTIGSLFLVDDIFEGYRFDRFAWPTALIVIGLIMALRPRFARFPSWDKHDQKDSYGIKNQTSDSYASAPASWDKDLGDVLDVTAVFGGVKRNVMSKNFRGGEIVAVLGGAEINLAHADFEGVIRLEAVSVLGGTKLIVPPNWDVQSEMVAVFGGVEDKRVIRAELIDPTKKLILEGTCFLGGIEIRNY